MRNEDKARAHLQSAMKYLGFGLTEEEEKAWQKVQDANTQGHVRYPGAPKSEGVKHNPVLKRALEGLDREYNAKNQAKKTRSHADLLAEFREMNANLEKKGNARAQ